MQENADQNNSEYGYFSPSAMDSEDELLCILAAQIIQREKLRVWFQRVSQHWSHGIPEVLIAFSSLSMTVINTFQD